MGFTTDLPCEVVLDGMPDLLRGVGGRGRSGSTERQVVAVVWAATRVIIFTL